jgi:hypothetical protein
LLIRTLESFGEHPHAAFASIIRERVLMRNTTADLPATLHDDQVLTFRQWTALNNISPRTGRRILKAPGAPVVTQLSARRIGIKVRHTVLAAIARARVMSACKHKKRKGKLPPFVPLIRTTLASPAWKQLSFGARSLYVALRGYLRHDNLNNGKVFRSCRNAGRDLGTNSIRSVRRWFRELEHYGFIVKTAAACLGVDGDGIAAHWRLTECHSFDSKGTHIAATRDFDRWDGTPFDDPEKNRIPSPKGTHPESQRDSYWRSKAGPKGVQSESQRDS